MSSRKELKEHARAERLAREAERRPRESRQRLLQRAGAAVAAAVAVVVVIVIATTGNGATSTPPHTSTAQLAPLASLGKLHSPGPLGPIGPEGVPVPNAADLASAGSGAPAATIDGIQCLGAEQLLFHIHAHLTVYVDGQARRIPYGIGIRGAQVVQTPAGPFVGSGSCFYWLHTHAADGIIHMESPVQRTFTLGNFFDVWGQSLSPQRVGPVVGPVSTIYNGRVYRGNPRDVPLTAHAQIQLEVGQPAVAPVTIAFPGGL